LRLGLLGRLAINDDAQSAAKYRRLGIQAAARPISRLAGCWRLRRRVSAGWLAGWLGAPRQGCGEPRLAGFRLAVGRTAGWLAGLACSLGKAAASLGWLAVGWLLAGCWLAVGWLLAGWARSLGAAAAASLGWLAGRAAWRASARLRQNLAGY